MTTDRPLLSIRDASDAAGVSVRTIRRRLAAGAFPNAVKDATDPLAPWAIPVEDLLAAGFTLHASTPEPLAPMVGPVEETELARLRAENAELRHRAELAEALAAERAARVEDLALALRAIAPPVEDAPSNAPPVARRRWWNR